MESRMKSRLFNLLVMLIFLTVLVVGQPSAQVRAAASWTVTTTTDSNDAACTVSLCSLRDAIAAASSGDSIIFGGGVIGTITLSSQLNINTSMTITGPGSGNLSVSGNDLVRVFVILGAYNVNISGLTITHGHVSNDSGGGIYNSVAGSVLTLDQDVISYNQAVESPGPSSWGGGIANFGSAIITNSTLSYNSVGFLGGGLFNNDGASLSMTNVIVDHNQATGTSGAAGGLMIRPGSVTLNNVSITNNSAAQSTGGLDAVGTMTITSSLIANNTSAGNTGGVFFADGNSAVAITMTNVTVTGNSAASYAGGISVYFQNGATALTINNTTIAKNLITSSASTGGLLALNTAPLVQNTIILENTIIAGNTSSGVTTPNDCNGTINSQDYNLIQTPTVFCTFTGTTTHNVTGQDPLLVTLAQNDGPTQTMALPAASPAVDAGNNATCSTVDQRGHSRPKDGNGTGMKVCDIGAFELDNDDFNTPKLVNTFPYSDNNLDTTGFTTASDDPAMVKSPCNSDPGLASAWYSITPSVTQTVLMDTFGSSYDTVMTVWTGTRGPGLTAVACNDTPDGVTPQAALTVTLTALTTYYIEIIQFKKTCCFPLSVGGGTLDFHLSNNAFVKVTIGGKPMGTYAIPPGGRVTPGYNGVQDGPVHVVGANAINIFTSERSIYGTDGFNELMGYPGNQLTTDYWFTWYDKLGMITRLLIGNPNATETANVDVYIAGNLMGNYQIPPGGRAIPGYDGVQNGPVHVISKLNGNSIAVPIFASERSIYGTDGFNELMGYPANQLTTDYWFTWYDKLGMITRVLIGVP
jgi:CSLREA domain-containing protein